MWENKEFWVPELLFGQGAQRVGWKSSKDWSSKGWMENKLSICSQPLGEVLTESQVSMASAQGERGFLLQTTSEIRKNGKMKIFFTMSSALGQSSLSSGIELILGV